MHNMELEAPWKTDRAQKPATAVLRLHADDLVMIGGKPFRVVRAEGDRILLRSVRKGSK